MCCEAIESHHTLTKFKRTNPNKKPLFIMGKRTIETMPLLYLSLNTISLLPWMVCDLYFSVSFHYLKSYAWNNAIFWNFKIFLTTWLFWNSWYLMNRQLWMSKFDKHGHCFLKVYCLDSAKKLIEFKSRRKSIFNIHVTKVCKSGHGQPTSLYLSRILFHIY